MKTDEGHKAYLFIHSQKAFSMLSEISKNTKKKISFSKMSSLISKVEHSPLMLFKRFERETDPSGECFAPS